MRAQVIENFYRNWLANLPILSEGYIYDSKGKLRPPRYIFRYFKQLILDFLTDQISESQKIILLPGIRGVGKTTLLMQLFNLEKFLGAGDRLDSKILQNLKKFHSRLYLDVSKLHLEQISLKNFFSFFEKANKINFVSLQKKVLLLLDEIHFDENWDLLLKTLFDTTKGHKNLLVIATGSSAINLKMSPDLMRRSTLREFFPLKFSDYLLLKHDIYPKKTLTQKLRQLLFASKRAEEVFKGLKDKQEYVDNFFTKLPLGCEEDFFNFGGFPFCLKEKNEVEIIERIKSVINGIILRDVITLRNFKTQTINKIADLVYLLAVSDVISHEKLLKTLKIENIRTLMALLDVLVLSGMLVKIRAFGRSYGSARKTPKYLFITPSLRMAILGNNPPSGIEGKKLEDYFALIFKKDLGKEPSFGEFRLSYDSAKNGADFILTLKDNSHIVVEVGFGKEDIKQVKNTMAKIKNVRYGLVVGSKRLEITEGNIVKIPLKFLLLA